MSRIPLSLRLFGRTATRGLALRRFMILVLLFGVTVLGGLSMVGIRPSAVSSLWNIPAIESTPGGNRQRESRHYQETVRTANDRNVTHAMADGTSHLPIPESIPEERMTERSPGTLPWMSLGSDAPVTDPDRLPGGDGMISSEDAADRRDVALDVASVIDVAAEAPPPVQDSLPMQVREVPVVHQQELVEAHEASILAQMGAIAAGMTIGPMGGQVLIEDGLQGVDSATRVMEDPAGTDDLVRIRAGDILYGSMLLAADSENATPVLARIESGELAGGRLVGTFAPAEGQTGLIITFRTLVDPGGQEHAINAFAIDGVSGASPVVSRVGRRILARYGPILASSFLAGLAQSAAAPRTVMLNSGGAQTIIQDEPAMTKSLYAGLAAAANQAQQDIVNARPRGPRVIVAAGHPIGILFLESVGITGG